MSEPRPSLFIVDGSGDVTGALISASRQAELLKDEMDTILVLSSFHRVPPERTSAFAEVITLPFVSPRKKLINATFYLPSLLLSAIMLRAKMRRRSSQLLQLNDFYLLHGAVLRWLGFSGRIVTFVRIDPTRYGAPGRWWLRAARWCSTEMAAVSKFIQSLLGSDFPTRLVYGQVRLGDVAIARPDLDRPLILFVGNMIEGKGQDIAIVAFHRLASLYPTARLRLVGGDMGLNKNRRYTARLKAAAADGPGADRIEFVGATDDVSPHYASAFAALNCSESESFSITCLDGSAAGLPVVATRCGGPEEIVEDGRTGFLVPVGDPKAVAERLAWLLDRPAEAAAMGHAGRALVAERFSPERARAALTRLFAL
ncbi:MAG: glycosyltransferase family 4 protein [Pseudomonadota bacterium]